MQSRRDVNERISSLWKFEAIFARRAAVIRVLFLPGYDVDPLVELCARV
jgi:hypothetical protein